MTAVSRAVLELQYEVARLPIGVLDVWVLGYLPENSALRLSFGRVLGSLDTAAPRLEDDATRPSGRAGGQLTAVPHDRPGRREQARRDHRAAIAEDLRAGRADKRRVTAQADARADTVRDWARAAARDRLHGVEARRSAERTRIDTPGQQTAAAPETGP